MHGYYSRHGFDPSLDFAAVLNQQGRVALDADWNELNEILQRRWRAETVDIIGRCVVPRETPDGFNIRIAGVGPQRTIGPGRMYVDGLLAENHGGAPFSFDMATARADGSPVGVLGELVGQEPVRYEDQPYRGAPLAYPEENGPHLVYLDVWQREVTALQAPSPLEEALGGVDTTTRLQTVWQVRFLENIPRTVTCATPEAEIPGWLNLTRPNAGRLSTRTREEAQPADPCLLPPSGGYRGLENQLYRIEIHNGGDRSQATLKWSRNNASVGTRIESFEGANIIRVASLGRDEMLGFAVGDWVEVTDDWRELDGRPGEMAQIIAINPDSRQMRDISDNFFNGTSIAAIRVMGTVADGAPLNIRSNTIQTNGDGIVVAADNARITDNDITAVNPGRGGNGIVLTEASGNEGGIDRCQVLGNRITPLGGAGIFITNTHLRSAMIKQNIIDSVSGGGITMDAESSADDLTMENNQVRNVASTNTGTGETLTAIRILNTQNAVVVGNTIDGVAVEAIGDPSRAGIQVVASRSIRIAGNELVHIGPAETGGPGVVQIGGTATGIDLFAPFDHTDVTHNTVKRSRTRPNNPDPCSWFAVRIRPVVNQFPFTDRFTLLPADDAGNILHVTVARLFILPRGQEITAIRGNLLESHDSTASLVSVGQGTCVFTDNRCVTSFGPLADFSPAEVSVALAVGRAIVSNNYVEAPPLRTIPIRLNPPSDALNFFTVLGNITSGAIQIGDAPLPDRWAELNVSAL